MICIPRAFATLKFPFFALQQLICEYNQLQSGYGDRLSYVPVPKTVQMKLSKFRLKMRKDAFSSENIYTYMLCSLVWWKGQLRDPLACVFNKRNGIVTDLIPCQPRKSIKCHSALWLTSGWFNFSKCFMDLHIDNWVPDCSPRPDLIRCLRYIEEEFHSFAQPSIYIHVCIYCSFTIQYWCRL